VFLDQLLVGQGRTKARVPRANDLEHVGAEQVAQGPVAALATATRDQASGAVSDVRVPESLDLSHAHPELRSGLALRCAALHERLHPAQPLQLVGAHGDRRRFHAARGSPEATFLNGAKATLLNGSHKTIAQKMHYVNSWSGTIHSHSHLSESSWLSG